MLFRSLAELLDAKFDPRLCGSPGSLVHFRYLACVLRVADVLEFDPERTPEVVFRHRQIAADSVIHWHRCLEVSLKITQGREGGRLVVMHARPQNAYVQNAVEKMIEDVDRELWVCQRLQEERPFHHAAGLPDQPHRWDLHSTAYSDIRPLNDAYVYIDGAFRPNTEKVLQMLGGLELYGDRIAAVRELVQNAFDTVKEQIARERLRQPGPEREEWELDLGKQHCVTLRIENTDQRWWLICEDDGAGMSREIIERHLLVSGTARRQDVIELERRCKAARSGSVERHSSGSVFLAIF